MKKKTIIILAALIIVAVGTAITLVSCSQSEQAEPTQASVVSLSETESSAEESAESSLVSETTSDESSDTESSVQSKAESSEESKKASSEDEESKTEKSEVSKTESKQESSKAESSAETSKSESSKAATSQAPSVVKVTGISLDKSSLTLREGDTVVLSATISPSNATNKNFEWSWSDSSVISVDGNGNVKALGAGSATITVKTKDGSYTASCKVTVKAASQSQTSQQQSSSGNNGGNNNGGQTSQQQSSQQSSTVDLDKYDDERLHYVFHGYFGVMEGPDVYDIYPSMTFDKSAHRNVKSTGGYTMYEVPELTECINKRREYLGLSPVQWSGSDNASIVQETRDWFYSLPEKKQESIKKAFPESFTSGSFDAVTYIDNGSVSIRNALEYCITSNSLNHGNNYGADTANVNMSCGNYNPQLWIDATELSPAHWESLMNPSATEVYAVCVPSGDGYICCLDIT